MHAPPSHMRVPPTSLWSLITIHTHWQYTHPFTCTHARISPRPHCMMARPTWLRCHTTSTPQVALALQHVCSPCAELHASRNGRITSTIAPLTTGPGVSLNRVPTKPVHCTQLTKHAGMHTAPRRAIYTHLYHIDVCCLRTSSFSATSDLIYLQQ